MDAHFMTADKDCTDRVFLFGLIHLIRSSSLGLKASLPWFLKGHVYFQKPSLTTTQSTP